MMFLRLFMVAFLSASLGTWLLYSSRDAGHFWVMVHGAFFGAIFAGLLIGRAIERGEIA